MKVINMVMDGKGSNPDHQIIVQYCKELMSLDSSFELNHVLREVNRATDWIARWAANQDPGVYALTELPPTLEFLMEEDEQGVGMPCKGTC